MLWAKHSKCLNFIHWSKLPKLKLIRSIVSRSVPVVLVGNKTDLHQERAVSYEEGKKLAESWRASFLETSAKQNEVSSFELRAHFNSIY